MGSVIAQFIPLGLGAAISPIQIIIVLLLLASPRGLAKGAAYVVGMALVRLAQGIAFGYVFGASPDAAAQQSGASPVVSTLLLVIGILMLITSYRTWNKETDPDDPPRKWMQAIETMTILKALGLGALLIGIGAKYWVFTLSAIAIIRVAQPGQAQSITAFLIYIALAQIFLILPVIMYAVAREGSAALLKQATAWLMA